MSIYLDGTSESGQKKKERKPMKRLSLYGFLSFFYLLLLLYQVATAKLLPSLISFLMFWITSPKTLIKWKTKHRELLFCLNFFYFSFILLVFIFVLFDAANMMERPIPEAEQQYIQEVLSQITLDSTKEEVKKLFGTPDRNMVVKLDWWVDIEGEMSRLTVYFSTETSTAEKITLNGGFGRFYYVHELGQHRTIPHFQLSSKIVLQIR